MSLCRWHLLQLACAVHFAAGYINIGPAALTCCSLWHHMEYYDSPVFPEFLAIGLGFVERVYLG